MLETEETIINIPSDAVNAIAPIFGFIIIIKPHIIEIMEHINIDDQLLYSYFLSNNDNIKSKVDLSTITIPITIGNNVFIKSGFINKTIPNNNSTTPNVKNEVYNKLDSFSIIK